jgi:short-subunit dehydrogenase
MKIEGTLAVVTGASSGIGEATAKALAEKGARVALLARRRDALEDVAAAIVRAGGEARAYPVDCTDAEAVSEVAERIKSELGVPDIIVNNAGAGAWRFIEETSPAEAVEMMAAPYYAAFNVTRAFISDMLVLDRGRIVNVNSPASRIPWPGAVAYTAARWAQRGFAEALRADLYGTGIRVTHFVAGLTKSPYWEHNPGSRERLPKIAKLVPPITADEAAEALVRGIERDKREVVTPFMMKVVYIEHALAPRLVEWLMQATGHKRC